MANEAFDFGCAFLKDSAWYQCHVFPEPHFL